MRCNIENYVPIVVPGLSTGSSTSSTPTSPASLPQNSVSCTLRPAAIRSESMSERARRDPLRDLPEWLEEFTKSCRGRSSSTQGLTREFFSRISFRAAEKSGIGQTQYFRLLSRRTEIAISARGPKLQGLRAEDALVKSYLVQKMLVTW